MRLVFGAGVLFSFYYVFVFVVVVVVVVWTAMERCCFFNRNLFKIERRRTRYFFRSRAFFLEPQLLLRRLHLRSHVKIVVKCGLALARAATDKAFRPVIVSLF